MSDNSYSQLYISIVETPHIYDHNIVLDIKDLKVLLTAIKLKLVKVQELIVDSSIESEKNGLIDSLVFAISKDIKVTLVEVEE